MIVETKLSDGRHTPAASYMCNKPRHGTDLPLEDRRPGMQKIAIRCRILDEAVWDRVQLVVNNPEFLSQKFAGLRATDPIELDLAAIDRRVKDVTRRERNHFAALEEEDDPDARAALRARRQALGDEHASLNKEREVVLARCKEWQDGQAQIGEIEAWCAEFRGGLTQMPCEIKREVLRALDVKVVVYPHDHEPRYEIKASGPLEP
jgi:hypothetical protein